jgi:integrase
VWALVRAARDEQDAAIFLTAAFAGLRRGELVGLRVRDVDFAGESLHVMGSVDARAGRGTTKGGRGRTVPMVPEVAQTLARLLNRPLSTGDDEPLFPGQGGGTLDGSALRRRYKAAQKRAGLRPIRFHDLRHTFGSLAVRGAESIRELQEWLGHADAKTTARYAHYKSRGGEARRIARAFQPASGLQANGVQTDAGGLRRDAVEEAGSLVPVRVSAEPGGSR